MSRVLTDNKYYSQIADVIREQNGTNNTYKPAQMVSALKDLFYEEVEGVPPITFQGIGENLLDYRIDGASGGVGDRTKNLLKNTAYSRTINGVTFTVNNDKSITCNGTASATIDYRLVALNSYSLPAGNYHLTGAPQTASYSSYYLRVWYNSSGSVTGINDFGRGANFTLTDTTTLLCAIIIASQQVLNNVTFYPMIRLASIEDDTYEPYGYKIPVTLAAGSTETTNIYLDEPLKKGRIYGFHIDPSVSDSSNAVTYIADAVGKTPAAMGANTFSYGDWENAFFMPKPCMLKSDGTVDYYLDPNDYTKKADGTPSDVANASYDGNAMMEWGKIWYRFVPTETDGEVYFYVADYKADNDYQCWCNIDSQNNETDHFYTAIYNGTGTEKLRSISGVILTSANGNGGTTVTDEVTRATANNTTNNVEWYTEVYSDKMLINMLLVLMGKSLNSQAVYGRGLDTGGQTEKEAYMTGALNDKGLFWGDISAGTSGVKVFGMENYWGCVWHRTAGFISIDNHAYAKLTYSTADGSSTAGYNQTGNGYLDFGSLPNTNGWIKTMKYNSEGFIPSAIDGTNVGSNYYGDYYYQSSRTRYLLMGGRAGSSDQVGSSNFVLSNTSLTINWNISTTLSCKPMSKGSKNHIPDYIDYATQKRHNSDGTESSVTLPEIAVTAGTNVLTVDTTVQPSNVYVKSRHESSYETAMRERYEEAQAQLDALESE